MPPAPAYITQQTLFWEFTAVVIGVVALLSLVMNSLYHALNRARQNEAMLAQKVEEAQILAQQAVEASEFKTGMLARVSHELRTPLGALLGMAEMLNQGVYGSLPASQHEAVARIIFNAQALNEVVSELLDQSQIELGQLVLKERPFSPRELIKTVQNKCLPAAQLKGLELQTDLAANLPPTLIGDENRIEQILSNLVFNAVKFTETGHVLISARVQDADQWQIQVTDTGIGMDELAQTHIFEPFRQIDETTGRQFGGVGLGLSIVRQLVGAMNGSISVKSRVGAGSQFTVTLPQHITQDELLEAKTTSQSLSCFHHCFTPGWF